MKHAIYLAFAGAAAATLGVGATRAQTSPEGQGQQLPPVVVEQPQAKPAPKVKKAAKKAPAAKAKAKPATAAAAPQPMAVDAEAAAGGAAGAGAPGGGTGGIVAPGTRSGSLTVPTGAEAHAEINRTPGAVAIVSGQTYQGNTPAATVKDALDYVPGVMIRMNEGEQATHFSIRGSGLSRNADTRGIQVLMDGVIPLTRATGDTTFDEIDVSVYRYIEVYKGANGLRYGANGLGGAVNFVTPTGYDSHLFGARFDIGSFGFTKWAATSGGVYGLADYFISVSALEDDGFRQHTDGENVYGFANVGYKITEDIETRFYFSAADTSRRLAGTTVKKKALSGPESAYTSPGVCSFIPGPNVTRCQGNDNFEWNVGKDTDSVRVANKTSVRLAPGTFVEFGGFYLERDIEQRVFAYLMNDMEEEGGFARFVDDHRIGGFQNRFIVGVNIHNGVQHRRDFFNNFGRKGDMFGKYEQDSENTVVYAENSFSISPTLALVAGGQYVYASREQTDKYLKDGNQSGSADFEFWNPKGGLIWDVSPAAQVFANISKSGEAPTFSEITIATTKVTALKPQEATAYEVGTRGNTPDFKWDFALYRSEITNEFQCQTTVAGTGFCRQVNIPQSIHQGVEAGVGLALLKGMFEPGPNADRLWLNAAYTFNDFRYDNDPTVGNNELPGQPRHYLRAELVYKHPSGVYFGPNLEWAPQDYFVDAKNTLTVPSYAIWGAKAGFDNGGPVSFYIEGRNLADTNYISSANVASQADVNTSTLFYAGNGRAVYSGIQVRW